MYPITQPTTVQSNPVTTRNSLVTRPAFPAGATTEKAPESGLLLEDALWEELAQAIAAHDRELGLPDTDVSHFGLPEPPLRLYSVVGLAPHKGIVVEETTDLDLPRITVASPLAASAFRVGDHFGLGQNENELSIWAPDRAYGAA